MKVWLWTMAATFLIGCSKKEEPLLDKDAFRDILIVDSNSQNVVHQKVWRVVQKISVSNKIQPIVIDYPKNNSLFPPDFFSPSWMWSDPTNTVFGWILQFKLLDEKKILVGAIKQNKRIIIDPIVVANPNEVPKKEEVPLKVLPDSTWNWLKENSNNTPIQVTVLGLDSSLSTVLSMGSMQFSFSRDSVSAPVFYRDVPIMPTRNVEKGKISPVPPEMIDKIKWNLYDMSTKEQKVVLSSMQSCANCHSFSKNGNVMGLDIEGPQSDKGAYGIQNVSKNMSFGHKNIISWNYNFKGSRKKRKTIGFLSRISPTGKYVVTTVNEAVFSVNYHNYKYIQTFYPTRGLLAYYSQETGKVQTLPGADDPKYVHCNPVWTPDEKYIVFSRAVAKDPYVKGQALPTHPNDPRETQIQYNLYKIPFNNGKGGRPIPIEGASHNGMSNTFPKVSPDGKRIVFVKCKNGQLLRPDGTLWSVPLNGGDSRKMQCNLNEMNSWHSFSPNGRWMVFSSKGLSYYTQMFLTHIDEDGFSSPPILLEDATASNRAVNLPEFLNRSYSELDSIKVPAVDHLEYMNDAKKLLQQSKPEMAKQKLFDALDAEKDDKKFRSDIYLMISWLSQSHEEAIEWLEKSLKEDANYPVALFTMGMRQEKIHNIPEAVRYYNKSIEHDEKNFWALEKLAYIYLRGGEGVQQNIDKSIFYAESANQLSHYQEPPLLKTLARVYSVHERFQEAIEMANLGIRLAQKRNLQQEVRVISREKMLYQKEIPFLRFKQ